MTALNVPYAFRQQAGPIPLSELDIDLAYVSGKIVNITDYMTPAQLVSLAAGTTVDVTTSIAAAHAALPASGGTVNWAQGSFSFLTVSLPLYPKVIRWSGSGRWSSVLSPNALNIPLLNSAGQVSMAGGARFYMEHFGIKPHASGSTGMAIDCSNMSESVFRDIAFLQNGSATFALGFKLYAKDTAPNASNCYYNVFEQIYVTPTSPYTQLPLKRLYEITGTSGVHTFSENYVSGVWPDLTSSVVFIDTYCRQNTFDNCYFEGLNLTSPNAVIHDSGYGTKLTHCYFENTGEPYYSAAEIESGTREWSIIEGCAFAANTLSVAGSGPITQGAVFRDSYAYGSDADVLEFIYTYELIGRTESIAFNFTGTPVVKARTRWVNQQNFYTVINDNGLGQAVEAEGAAGIGLQSTGGGSQVAVLLAPAVTAGSALSYASPVFWQSGTFATGQSGLGAAEYLLKDNSTSRSINAAGTLNASGADYAEYVKKSPTCGDIPKGAICGIDINGELTDKFSEAVTFVVKSTDPSYVGNDAWGAGLKGDELEAERVKHDRIAFSGQVPVNIGGGFDPGDYIVPVSVDGAISCIAVFAVTFEQYRITVGRVVAKEPDGRPRIIVKVC